MDPGSSTRRVALLSCGYRRFRRGTDDRTRLVLRGSGRRQHWESDPSGSTWNHWSKFDPPVTPASKWHMSRMNPNASKWNAWAGCDSIVGSPGYSNNDAACSDIDFWIRQKGYGDDWNYALELRAAGTTKGASTIKFDVRYDTECNYDYLYVEYSTNSGTTWSFLRKAYPSGPPAVFNSISGNHCITEGGTGRCCGTDFFENSDQFNPGGGNINWNGSNHSEWIANVTFTIPGKRRRNSSPLACVLRRCLVRRGRQETRTATRRSTTSSSRSTTTVRRRRRSRRNERRSSDNRAWPARPFSDAGHVRPATHR